MAERQEPDFGALLGRLIGRGRVELERAARKGRDTWALRQMRSDRDRLYQKLGKEARHLLEAGEIRHPGLERAVQTILEMERRIVEAEDAARLGELSGGQPGGRADEQAGGQAEAEAGAAGADPAGEK